LCESCALDKAIALSLAVRARGAVDMTDLTPLTFDPQVHQSLRLLEAFTRISTESARREAIALVERLAGADAHGSKDIKRD
jgi:hypothetical protein